MRVFVPGIPIPKGNHKGFPYRDKITGQVRVSITDAAGKSLTAWQNLIAAHVRPFYPEPISGPIRITSILFVIPRPKSHWTKSGKPSSKWIPEPILKPDLDKLVRAVHDALTGVVYIDDSQVVSTRQDKRYTYWKETPGVEITIE